MNEPTQDGGPYSRGVIRVLAVVAGVLGVIVFFWGLILTVQDDPRGVTVLVIGAVCTLVVAVGVPYGIRRGRI